VRTRASNCITRHYYWVFLRVKSDLEKRSPLMYNSYTVHKFSDSYQIVDSAELSGFCYSGKENKWLHVQQITSGLLQKIKQPCCQTEISIEASHTLLLFLLCNCTHCQQISTGWIPYISLYLKVVKRVKSNKLIKLTNAVITLQLAFYSIWIA
jgi:hypothetical protein